MKERTFQMNGETYYLIPSKTEDELEQLRTICGYGSGCCECGCGTPVGPDKKGRPRRFVNGHQMRGSCHYGYKGGRYVDSDGYVMVYQPDHPRPVGKGYVREHILIMERELGRPILTSERVHHIDGNRANNDPDNLTLFCSHSEHTSYEARLRAFKACGHYNWKLCLFCHKYDDPANMVGRKQDSSMYHKACRKEYEKNRLQLLKEEEA